MNLVRTELQPKFNRISDRICTAEINLKNNKLLLIAAYAHTLDVCNKSPEFRENFYNTLEGIIHKTPKRNSVIVAGDLNAKTGSGYQLFPENMGRFGKGVMNESGKRLLEMCYKEDLILTNTTYNIKQSHRTTWTAPSVNSSRKRVRPDEIL